MQVDLFHLLCGDLAPRGVFAPIQATDYAQAFRRGGAADQIDDRFVIVCVQPQGNRIWIFHTQIAGRTVDSGGIGDPLDAEIRFFECNA